jgi:hypothetical protein
MRRRRDFLNCFLLFVVRESVWRAIASLSGSSQKIPARKAELQRHLERSAVIRLIRVIRDNLGSLSPARAVVKKA